MPSNMPPGYSEDGNAPTHGKETAAWQELQSVRGRWGKWLNDFRAELNDDELTNAAEIDNNLHELSDSLGQPL